MPLTRLRLFSFLLVLLAFLTVFVAPSLAQAFPPTQLFKNKQDAVLQGGNQEAWLSEALISNSVAAVLDITGTLPDNVLNGTAPINWVPGGLIQLQTQMIASLYSPPASGVQYLAQMKDSFLGKPAYAQQGQGFAGLQPILPIWRGFRNITYILSSIIFIIVGLMIMLRVKISPQAVVTIQNAIPGLITTLILITFSYAIAGLLIDAMQFLQSLVMALLFDVTGKGLGASLLPGIKNYNFQTLSTGGMNTISDLTFRAVPMAPLILLSSLAGALIGGVIGSFLPITAVGGAAIGVPAAIIILLLILLISFVVWMFKFYFGCLKVYITIIFKIIIAPLELAMGAFPNSKMGFNTWIWDLIANLAVFPISMIFLVVGNMIIDQARLGLWAPEIIRGISLQSVVITAAALGNIVAVGIGLAVVALMSKLPEMIPQFIFSIKPSPWQLAVGEGLKTPKWVGNTWGLARSTGQQLGHDRLMDVEEGGGTIGEAAGAVGRGMELLGWAKERRDRRG